MTTPSLATADVLRAMVVAFGAPVPPSCGFSELLNDLVQAIQNFSPGGGGHSPVVRHFPFAYNTANLTTGATIYTPTIGDVLLDAWVEVDTAWNGTTPKFDVGTFSGTTGLYSALGTPPSLLTADTQQAANNGLQINLGTNSESLLGFQATNVTSRSVVPALIIAANPIKVVVSQTGASGGASPGATQGSAVAYLVTVTPQ